MIKMNDKKRSRKDKILFNVYYTLLETESQFNTSDMVNSLNKDYSWEAIKYALDSLESLKLVKKEIKGKTEYFKIVPMVPAQFFNKYKKDKEEYIKQLEKRIFWLNIDIENQQKCDKDE